MSCQNVMWHFGVVLVPCPVTISETPVISRMDDCICMLPTSQINSAWPSLPGWAQWVPLQAGKSKRRFGIALTMHHKQY